MTEERIKEVLRQHKLWVETDGKEGVKANLSYDNLYDAALYGADLRYANLESVSLNRANLKCADLRHARLRGVVLEGADLSDTKF